MKKRSDNFYTSGFTLIELLIVVAIIGVLAVAVIVNIDIAHAKSRDARRVSDLDTIGKAYEMYYLNNNTYTLNNAGAASPTAGPNFVSLCGGAAAKDCGASSGHFNYGPAVDGTGGYHTTSLNKALINGGYLVGTVDDPACPLAEDSTAAGDLLGSKNEFCYLIFYADSIKLSIYAHTETLSATVQNDSLSKSTMNDTAYIKTHYGVNYAKNIVP